MVDEVALEQVFLQVSSVSPAEHYSTIAPHSAIAAP
jgi:hypothetical protein